MSIIAKQRLLPPEQTLHNIQPLVQQAGITRLVNLTHLDTLGIPVYTAIRPLSKSLSTAQGKGLTAADAQCGALIEAIESYYAENIPTHHHAAAQDIPPHQRCFEALPRGLTQADASRPIDWTSYTDVSSGETLLVPTQFASFDLTQAHPENGWFHKTTTGLVSGNSVEEALVYSAYECIERHHAHSFHALNYSRKKERVLDIASLSPGPALDLIQRIHGCHAQCVIFNLQSHFSLPTFYCLLLNTHPLRKISQYEGYGAHWNTEVALCKAILEAAQSRLTYIAGSRDDIYHHAQENDCLDSSELSWPGKVAVSELPSRSSLTLAEQKQALRQELQAKNLQQLYIELTPRNSPISVVHSVIPGLAL
jgi:YcaO-like protein with predicted kinase domain